MTPEHMRALLERADRVLEKELFFVCGAPKSGTTWVQRLLDAHPEVACAGEGHFVDTLMPLLSKAFGEYNKQQKLVAERVYEHKPYYAGLTRDHHAIAAALLIALVISERGLKEGVRCVGDKTPRYAEHLDRLRELFPSAKVIHVVRDGRDVVASTCYHVLRTGDQNAFKKDDLNFYKWVERFAGTWAATVSAAESFARRHPKSTHTVRYEDLSEGPEEAIAGLLRFLGVDAAPDRVRECREAASFEKLSGGRKPGEEKATAFLRKGAVGDWRNHFDEHALALFERKAGGLMRRLGYRGDGPAAGPVRLDQ